MTECLSFLRFPGWTRACLMAGALTGFALPAAAIPEVTPAERLELVQACEKVLLEQSEAPLRGYLPAPLSSGKPGAKTYTYYSQSKALIVLARRTGKIWDLCTVQEVEGDRRSLTEWAKAWPKEFAAAFPASRYQQHSFQVPRPVEPFAVLCQDQGFALVIYPHFGQKSEFAVSVSNQLDYIRSDPCQPGSG
ncbi:hypothetical protein IQ03_01654 [Gemmobacter caeni]|jgi:hypothetical protein|uniref:Uncharacterized protein n=1 Tax=Gemmobacter caeni TaxID=589035 RepID=A0A2T6B212_9RHOB|nr:hypothetical protein [Gemmobacter caeni]PTX50108.1 hypothetical protein C8N34_106290 [Gemmobacter caeni]TWJ02002.1 hypothetical protein IQ03_01654 [Gemmobacter caeni]